MKDFELTIRWDRLRNGDFPKSKLEELGLELTVTIDRTDKVFEDSVTIRIIGTEIEDPLYTAYELGGLIRTYTMERYFR